MVMERMEKREWKIRDKIGDRDVSRGGRKKNGGVWLFSL